MKTLTFLPAFALSCFSLIAGALGQQEVRVRALCFRGDFPPELHAHHPTGADTAGLLSIKSYLNHESNLLKFEGDKLAFTRKSDPSSATDFDERLGELEVPTGVKSLILLFLPDEAEPKSPKSKVVAIDDSVASFPAGSFKVANYSSLPVKIELEKVAFEIPPGESKVIDKPKFNESQAATMFAYCKRDDEWRIAERLVVHDWFEEKAATGDWDVGPFGMSGLPRGTSVPT